MTDIDIRPARESDAEFLVPLIDRAGEGIPMYMWTSRAASGQTPHDFGLARVRSRDAGISWTKAWVAEVGGARAGCLIAHTQPNVPQPMDPDTPAMFVPLQELEDTAPGTGYVHILSTARDMRGRGIGSRLLGFAERFAGPNGMSLIVADNNVAAWRLYERHGYRETARRRMIKNGWQSDGTDWVLLVKAAFPLSRD